MAVQGLEASKAAVGAWVTSHLQAVVCHVDVSMDIGHGILEVGAVY